MGTEHDNAVDKVLAALRDAVPPEGMETRIAHRLTQSTQVRPAATPPWRALRAGALLPGA